MGSFSTLFRLPNLIIVGLSQLAIYYLFLIPIFSHYRILPVLRGHLIPLFVLVTILIAAAGYLINNIFDIKADEYNKPTFSSTSISFLKSKWSYIVYISVVLVGMAMAAYIAFAIDKLHLSSIYVVATILLFLYSYIFKRKPLIGNIIVAIFCAFVPGIIWFAESDTIYTISELNISDFNRIVAILIAYITFGFLATISREIVKDIEDIEGDRKSNYNTLPISAGIDKAKVVAQFNTILLLLGYSLWMAYTSQTEMYIMITIVFLFLFCPTLWWMTKLNKARIKKDYTDLSKWMKYIMIISLIIFLCIPLIRSQFLI